MKVWTNLNLLWFGMSAIIVTKTETVYHISKVPCDDAEVPNETEL